jgi:hypothetical protein
MEERDIEKDANTRLSRQTHDSVNDHSASPRLNQIRQIVRVDVTVITDERQKPNDVKDMMKARFRS